MQLKSIIGWLEELAPPSLQEDYDNSGLIAGTPGMEVTGVLVALDCTEAVLQEAISLGCNLVVAHHPIVFRGLKSLTGRNYVERTVIMALKHDIALYAIHTNLDHVRDGVNAALAARIGLLETRVLSPLKDRLCKLVVFVPHASADGVRSAMFSAGAGSIGAYDQCSFNLEGTGTFRGGPDTQPFVGIPGSMHHEAETRIEVILPRWRLQAVLSAMMAAHPYEEVAYDVYALENTSGDWGAGLIGRLPEPVPAIHFLAALKQDLQLACIRHTHLCRETIQTVALCGGAGRFLLPCAIAEGAEVFVSADFKYHEFFDADNQIIIADIGHYESEQYSIGLLADRLRRKCNTFATHLTAVVTNPVHYF
jgi:dinuclear metal center YbgI/SA1388 family protein